MVSPDECDELAALRAENAQLTGLLVAHGIAWRAPVPVPSSATSVAGFAPSNLSTAEKVALFGRLFRGRTDVYPVRWESKTSGTALATCQAKAVREAAVQAQQWTEGLRRLDSLAGEFEQALQSRVNDIEAHAVTLAFETICCLLGDRSQRLPLVQDLVLQGLTKLRGQPLRLRLNGQDLALLDTLAPTEGLRDRYPQIEWVADAGVVCGGCLIDTVAGTLDARLDSQLKRLLDLWREAGLPDALTGRVEE